MTSTPLKTSDISIIIPALNEEENIKPLAENLSEGDQEIILVDGGSRDNTVQVAQAHGFIVISSAPGRGNQLNRGAAAARGKVLLFLHADTRLPPAFAKGILSILQQKKYIAGAFRLAIAQPAPAMRFICACANLRSYLLQMPYGDQAIFILKKNFIDLGMYPDLPIMEDYIFIKKAQKSAKIALLPMSVTTSARRWKKLGVLRTTLINQAVLIGYHCGVSLEKLASLYRR